MNVCLNAEDKVGAEVAVKKVHWLSEPDKSRWWHVAHWLTSCCSQKKWLCDQHPTLYQHLSARTCDPDEDCEGKADQEQHEDQDKMSFGQGVEPHWGQSVTGRHSSALTRTHTDSETDRHTVFLSFDVVNPQTRICQHCLAATLVAANSNRWQRF